MPKELVFQKNQHGDPNTQASVVRVGWSKGQEPGQVEIATDPGADESGLVVRLDRDSINRLIRVLRRARDTAFGADA